MPMVRSDQADAFVAAPPRDVRLFLVLGPDEGLAAERSLTLSKALCEREGDGASVLRIDGDRLVADPDAYTSDLYGASLFGGTRVLLIGAGKRDLAGALKPLVERPSPDAYVVVEAGDLKKDSGLKAAFAVGRHCATIDCQPDDETAVAGLIDQQARQFGVKISEAARTALTALLGPDRMNNRHELEKLFLYARDKATVGVDDLRGVIAGTEPSPVAELIDDALSAKLKSPREALASFDGDPADLASFAYPLVTQLVVLMIVGEDMAQGQSFQSALREVQWRVRPTAVSSLQQQAQRWRPAAVRRLMPGVLKLLTRTRENARLAPILVERFVWNLITQAR